MSLTPEEKFQALVTLTAALITRSPGTPPLQQTVTDACGFLKETTSRVYESHEQES
jgi:hypothetical protein